MNARSEGRPDLGELRGLALLTRMLLRRPRKLVELGRADKTPRRPFLSTNSIKPDVEGETIKPAGTVRRDVMDLP